MPNSFRLETESYTSGGLSTQKLDMSKHLSKLALEIDIQYDTAASVTRIKDGYGSGLADFIRIRDGGKVPINIYGYDLPWVAQLLNKMAHGLTQVITTVSQSDQTIEDKFLLPVELNRGVYNKPILEISWGTATSLGTGYTIDSCTVNGTYFQSDLPVLGMKILPDTSQVNVTGLKTIDIPPEGRLAWILLITRAYATPFALRDGLTLVNLKIEDSYAEYDADNLKQLYSQYTGQSEQTGVYLIPLSERPLIGNNSKIKPTVDSTATDINCYFGYVSPRQLSEEKQPEIFGGNVVKGNVVTPSDIVAERDTRDTTPDYGIASTVKPTARRLLPKLFRRKIA